MICAVVVRKSASQGRAMKFEDGVACVMRAVYQARNIVYFKAISFGRPSTMSLNNLPEPHASVHPSVP